MLSSFAKLPRAVLPAFSQASGIGVVSMGLLLGLAHSIHAERSSERLNQAEQVASALQQDVKTDQKASPYSITLERRALLNTIRFAEGTWKDGHDLGYRTLYGGGQFEDLSKHPERVVVKRYVSAAAGAYQFLPTTWQEVSGRLNLPSFSPDHQDQAALHLVKRRGALHEVDQKGLTAKAMNSLAPEWASFPTHSGLSAYGQPVKSHAELASFYSKNLQTLRQGA
ncbi:MAG: endolysin [Synechococcus sp.]|nr:glycoside hydrolase family 104 protein [Synechococcus sp.]RCL60501.1 MAG: endolysin [Synechococcus sp. MED-G68]